MTSKEFEELFHSNYKYLFALGFKMSKNKALVKDLIQSLFMELWEKREKIGEVKYWNAYLRKSFYRKMLHALQQQKKQEQTLQNPPTHIQTSTPSYEKLLIQLQDETTRSQELQDALQQLPLQEQLALNMRFFQGLSYDEIALNTGKSKQTVYNQVFNAIKRLKKMLIK